MLLLPKSIQRYHIYQSRRGQLDNYQGYHCGPTLIISAIWDIGTRDVAEREQVRLVISEDRFAKMKKLADMA